jgi:lysozyme family protein
MIRITNNIAMKLFDLAVNTGIPQTVRLIRRALRAVGEDTVIGPATLAAVNKADPTALSAALKSEAAGYYRLLAILKPSQQRFLEGWINRAYS